MNLEERSSGDRTYVDASRTPHFETIEEENPVECPTSWCDENLKISPVRFSLGNLVESAEGFYAAGIVPIHASDNIGDKIGRIRSSNMFTSASSIHVAFKVNGDEGSTDDDVRFPIAAKLMLLIQKLSMDKIAIFVARWEHPSEPPDPSLAVEAALKATQDVLECDDSDPRKGTLVAHPIAVSKGSPRSSFAYHVVLSNFPDGFLSKLWLIARPHEILRSACTALATVLEKRPINLGWLNVCEVLKSHELSTALLMWTHETMTRQAWVFAKEQMNGITCDNAERAHAGGGELVRWLHMQLCSLGFTKDDQLMPCPVSTMKHAIFSPEGIVTINPSDRVRPKCDKREAKPRRPINQTALTCLQLSKSELDVITRERL